MCGGQVLIVMVGGPAFNISPEGQTPSMWGCAIILGALSIPFGMIIRLIPDELLARLVPEFLKRRSGKAPPDLAIENEEHFDYYPAALADVRDELAWLKRVKGGRLNNLRYAMKNSREHFLPQSYPRRSSVSGGSPSHSRDASRSHSRANSVRIPQTPTREDSVSSTVPTPDSRRRSRSMRSRSNSALGAPTVMAGIIAGSVAVGWSPVDRSGPDLVGFPRASSEHHHARAHPLARSESNAAGNNVLGGLTLTDEPAEMGEESGGTVRNHSSDVPRLDVPPPASRESYS